MATVTQPSLTFFFADSIPRELRTQRQWVVWQSRARPGARKPAKPPFDPTTGREAATNDAATWGTFQQALDALATGAYAGLGYVLCGDCTLVDLDDCRDPSTGTLTPRAARLVRQLNSYTEVSPSGTGVHILTRGRLPGPGAHNGHCHTELYDTGRYTTVTGQHLTGTPHTLQERTDAVASVYRQVAVPRVAPRRAPAVAPSGRSGSSDAEVMADLQRHERSRRLWGGAWAWGYPSQSHADLALCQFLGRLCAYDRERMDALFRQSGLYRPKWDERHFADGRTYGQGTLDAALATAWGPADAEAPGRRTGERRHAYTYAWQQDRETDEQRAARLSVYASHMQQLVQAHAQAGQPSWLVVKAPPGVGKSYAVSALALEQLDMAYVGENHAQHESLPALQQLREIEPCTEHNCPTPVRHHLLAEAGYKTQEVHWHNGRGCAYSKQFEFDAHGHDSTFYQVEHLKTPYPSRHQVLVVDELTLSKWLKADTVTKPQVEQALDHLSVGSAAATLLQGLDALLADTRRRNAQRPPGAEPVELHGLALFNALNASCAGRLADLVLELAGDPELAVVRPETGLERQVLEQLEKLDHLQRLPPTVLGRVVRALRAELLHWLTEAEWNSRLSLGPAGASYALRITEPLRLHERLQLPRVLLNATAHPEVLHRLFHAEEDVRIAEPMVLDPPPHTRHIAVRIRRYSKRWLERSEDERRRTIAEVRYLLHRVDPEGTLRAANQVGLITFQAVESTVRAALGIPEERSMHFWAARGSNRLADCSLLLVVGTPALSDDHLYREARALYVEDEQPIEEGVEERDGVRCYTDPRVQALATFRTNEELTQCAHRNRPLRYDGRTVVTFCQGEVEYLPITEEVTDLPTLTAEGTDRKVANQAEVFARLDAAEAALRAQGAPQPTRRAIRARARAGQNLTSAWWALRHPQAAGATRAKEG